MALELNENQDFNLVEDEEEVPVQFGPLPLVQPTTYSFHGIDIQFPFPAYPCQQELAEAIIYNLNSHSNCLLESATGSGKTLALLCSLLAWQKNQEEQRPTSQLYPQTPKIYYATRTVGHIEQIVSQLRLTAYTNTPMGILASREQTCANEQPLGPDDEDYDPREVPIFARADNHFCRYRPNYFGWAQHINSQANKTWNIQELNVFCTHRGTCPYFELLNAKRDAKIIFCTFNYLLHSGIRRATGIDLRNNIVVFDEGHNVEEISREIASTRPGLLTMSNITNLTWALLQHLNSPGLPVIKQRALRNLYDSFKKLKDFLQGNSLQQVQGLQLTDLNTSDILQALATCGFGSDHVPQLWNDYFILKDRSESTPQFADFEVNRSKLRYLSNVIFAFEFFYGSRNRDHYDIYVECLNPEDLGDPDIPSEFELRLICLNPAVCFSQLNVARSVIITSGTLSPMERTSLELGIPFETQLSAAFAIPTQRIFTAIVDRYEDGAQPLYLSKAGWDENWNNYQDQVAKIIQGICLEVPHGILVFFPSKGLMQYLIRVWLGNGHMARILGLKRAFVEPEQGDPDALNATLAAYRENLGNGNGSILFAVMRGKFSEGIDFRDNQARALVTVGIPFMPAEDTFVKAKRQYEAERVDLERDKNGWEWYFSNAMKALNQALGRSLRHLNDWSSIFLIDARFLDPDYGYDSKLPTWVRETSARNINGNGTPPKPFTELLPGISNFVADLNH